MFQTVDAWELPVVKAAALVVAIGGGGGGGFGLFDSLSLLVSVGNVRVKKYEHAETNR